MNPVTLSQGQGQKFQKGISTRIRVDRTIKPIYPGWVSEIAHPELEGLGPDEYDLSTVELWLHEDQGGQENRYIAGNKLYGYLKDNSLLPTCLTLRDGEEIKRNGVNTFRKFFHSNSVFLWGSVVKHCEGDLYVPSIYDDSVEVVVHWIRLGLDWTRAYPAGRHES